MSKEFVEGFSFDDRPSKYYGFKPTPSVEYIGETWEFIFDHTESITLYFKSEQEIIIDNNSTYMYQLLPVDTQIYLLTIHMLIENPERNLTFAIDLETRLVTKVDSIITTIKRDSTRLVEGTNLVQHNIDFGYIKTDKIPYNRHYQSDDLVDHGFAYMDSPVSTIHYHVHSAHKISYYQKKFPDNGNEIDRDGVGYGELDCIRINEETYLLTFIKHSHGNQPILLWSRKNQRIAANFFGISRRLHIPFLSTGGGYTKLLY